MSFWRWTLAVALLVLVSPAKQVDVQNALQQLLGVPSGDRGSSLTPPLPSYMMELYERYKSGDMLGAKQGNTVRSIHALKDNKMAHQLLFNLSGIHQQERILTAELHLHQFPKRRAIHDRVRLFTLDEAHRHHRLKSVESHANINGWSVYNVTDGVIQLRTSNSSSHQLLFGVRSVSGSKKRKLKTRKTLSKSGSVPFLIVFSQDKNSLQSDTSIPNNGMPELTTRRQSRRVRSLMDNRVIENDFGLQNNEFPQTRPFNPNPVSVSNNNPSILLPRGRAKSRPTRRPPFGKDEKNEEKHQYPNKSQNDANKFDFCQRKKLVVDFAQIGWSKWIIFPKTFEAHYCAGACPFPLTKNVNPSNHATIQSLVHALGVSDDIPAPCCVPSTMSSMSLLYLDQDGDVVLKNYPQMTVESCACR